MLILRKSRTLFKIIWFMLGKKMAADLEECNLEARILLTLHLAERRGMGFDFYKKVLEKNRWFPEMQKPYALFGDRV